MTIRREERWWCAIDAEPTAVLKAGGCVHRARSHKPDLAGSRVAARRPRSRHHEQGRVYAVSCAQWTTTGFSRAASPSRVAASHA